MTRVNIIQIIICGYNTRKVYNGEGIQDGLLIVDLSRRPPFESFSGLKLQPTMSINLKI